ncbi:uncharacterized protein LOC114867291 [Betta splendens]|uniref:Uncharacterized protein LOC114867291 n=1 Tax=Betta splendens TaxID=158456 RepID=A0A6P7P8D6_BETSP|nr:uncharacterized protein LOC114867291 [Betta splendens]
MSSEKNPEVVGCDASIMKNVWEIRAREYRQKMQLEQERLDKSALPLINQDWANRFTGKLGNHKRVEMKRQPGTFENDNNNIWKDKQAPVPAPPPRGAASGLLRPGGQNRSVATQAPNHKDKKQLEKKRLQLLAFIAQSQPSSMVWGKSWKYNKSLPPAEGSAASHWGQCWMFATQQPHTEEGKPWPNGPNSLDPHSLHLWKQADRRARDSRGIEWSPLTEQWQTSWKKADTTQKKDMPPGNGETGLFALLEETQHYNAAEWTKSWQSTKAANQHSESFTDPGEGLMDQVGAGKQDAGVTSRWEICWRLSNHHGCNHSELLQVNHCHSPEWAAAWRTAVVASNNSPSTPLLRRDGNDEDKDCSQTRLTHLHRISNQRHRDLHLQLCSDLEVLTEWNKSWQVVKNNLKPSEEMEKVLKSLESLKMKENDKKFQLTSEKVHEQLKHKNESESSHYSNDLQTPMRYIRPVSDWQANWMVSESDVHHDNASLSQWSEAWMSSTGKIQHWAEDMSREERENEAVEIQPMKEIFIQRAKQTSQCMDNQTFRGSYPMEDWGASWKASSLPNLQLSLNECSGTQRVRSTPDAGTERGSELGMSFRLAIPMPHMEKHWAESTPNPHHYTVVWPAGRNITRNQINTSCVQIFATLRLWQNSHVFVNSAQINKSKESTDPRVIIRKQINTRKHLCSYIKKGQSDRKWAGCHLLGKTQPRPKKTSAPVPKLSMDNETNNSFEEWGDSWRCFVRPGMKKHTLSKSLSGWNESWKFLLPPRQTGNSPKAR